MNEESIRINKYLSQAGVCSRRQADEYISKGLVTINGTLATNGDRVNNEDEVCFRGKLVKLTASSVLLAFHKPKGIICSSKYKDNIVDYVHYKERIYPVGRLDKDSTGLILLTNQGDVANEIMKARNYHEKEYEVKVNKSITNEFLEQMRSGVSILDTVTRPCVVKKISNNQFSIILTQGLNRQIRRMCDALGYRVVELKRVRVMNIHLDDLKVGEYREIKGAEYKELIRRLEDK